MEGPGDWAPAVALYPDVKRGGCVKIAVGGRSKIRDTSLGVPIIRIIVLCNLHWGNSRVDFRHSSRNAS